MKYLNRFIIALSLFALVLSGCEQTEFEKTEENIGKYVSFSSSSASIQESSSTTTADGNTFKAGSSYTVEVFRSSSDLSQALNLSITSSVTYASTSDFANAGDDASSSVVITEDLSAFTIPANEVSATFVISSLDDEFSSGDKLVNLTINNVADARFNIGAQGQGGDFTLTIIDDDCPIDLASFEGEYSMTVVGTVGARFDGFDLCAAASRDCSGPVTLTADSSDPLGQTAILTHPSFGGEYKIQFITCPKQVVVVQPMTSFFNIGAWQMQQGSMPGSYNEDSKAIEIIGVLGSNGNFTISLSKNN